jgi:hypothetical protein
MRDLRQRLTFLGLLLAAPIALSHCTPAPEGEASEGENGEDPALHSPTGTRWLTGNVNKRLDLVAKHLRGFDVAMAEVGYRYAELSWAARDRNWEYAGYQLEKIQLALDNGLERRPLRAESAKMLAPSVQGLHTALEARDGVAADAAMESLTASCNACHRAEKVAFIEVRPPSVRLSPVQPDDAHAPQGAAP